MNVPGDALYTASHEWLQRNGEIGRVGITDFAQSQLGDIVYVDLPAVGTMVRSGEPFGVIESVKAAVDLYAPASGEVIARNEALSDAPELVNSAPHDEGWMLEIRLTDAAELAELLTPAAYTEMYGHD